MSIWSKLIGIKKTEDRNNAIGNKITSVPFSAPNYAIVDVEVGLKDHKIHDIGALLHDGTTSAVTISLIMMPNICSRIKHAAGF